MRGKRQLDSEEFWRLVSKKEYPKLNDFALRTCLPKLPLFWGSGYLGRTRIHTPNGTLVGSSVFVRFSVVSRNRQTHTHTDHGTTVTVGRIF